MFDRPDLGDQAILVSLDFGDADYQESVAECAELVRGITKIQADQDGLVA